MDQTPGLQRRLVGAGCHATRSKLRNPDERARSCNLGNLALSRETFLLAINPAS